MRTSSKSPLASKTRASMGSFVGHIVPGLALIFLGLWHTINTIRNYHLNLKGSAKFVSTLWYPFKSPVPMIKLLELLFIFSFSIFAILVQVLDYPFLRVSFKLDNFEHATIFLHLAIFSGFTLFIELTRSSESLSGVSRILATSVFAQELFLLHYHSTDHVGLEGHYHFLLQLIVFLSLIAVLATASFPTSFPAALVLAISVVFQGCWFVNMGYMLWVPKFLPQGCFARITDGPNRSDMLGAVMCQTHEAEMRARALANMQFSWIFAGILILISCICLTFAERSKLKGQSSEYEQVQNRSGDVSVVITGFKQVNP